MFYGHMFKELLLGKEHYTQKQSCQCSTACLLSHEYKEDNMMQFVRFCKLQKMTELLEHPVGGILATHFLCALQLFHTFHASFNDYGYFSLQR